ncbi:hypothetical protein EU244_030875 [Rhodococcus qingshengii]|uniref:hypothetical protein n=1 Tax=Rhodococcus qingshengii TaxID=334542 RepID=UPI0010A5B709|nr:hypothetical protein [Rhodococcus qingshengii]THJ65704.1 hypothetical protein EU244_28855 [Rhodococcus qingshengii]
MTNSAQSYAVQIRGAGVGATATTTTAILAHDCAGGHWPRSAEWVLLLAVGCSLGVIAASANIFSRRVGLLMTVSAGQLAGHAVLSLDPVGGDLDSQYRDPGLKRASSASCKFP